MKKKVLTTELEAYDAWGKARRVKVAWKPQRAEGVWAGLDNLGRAPFIWEDEENPPVYLSRNNWGGVSLCRSIISLAGDWSGVFEAREVDSISRLKPGCYFIISDEKES